MTREILETPSSTISGGPGRRAGELVDSVLFLCPAYDCRYPSQTMWQRLDALRHVGAVRVLPAYPSPHACLEPLPGVTIELVGSEQRRKADLLRYPARVQAHVKRMAGSARSGLIWANSNLLTRRAAFGAARITGWPVVLDVWDTPDLPMWSQYREGRYLKALIHLAMSVGVAGRLEAADLVVWTLHPDAVNRYFQADEGKVLFLPNGVCGNELAAYQAADQTQQLDSRRPSRLLYMGHFRRSRGSTVLVETLARLRCSRSVELHVAGELSSAPARNAMLAIPEDLRPSIKFHGHLPWERAMSLLRASDICLYPFPRSPELEHIYPLKLLEYAALNKWIVSSDLAGAQFLLRDYEKVRFCDPDRPAEWAETVATLLEAPSDEVQRFRNEALIQEYDWDTLKHRLVDRLAPLLARTKNAGVS